MLQPLRIQLHDYTFLMVPIEGGSFMMGDEKGDLWEACRPEHAVEISSFYLAQYPVTQELWEIVMGEPWPHLAFRGICKPMERTSWEDIQLFLARLNEQTNFTFRLPTESEWEYAARGGRFNSGCAYAGSDRLSEAGWFYQNSHSETKVVGKKLPNELGLYDMSGNVWEWCADDWHSNYEGAPEDGKVWIEEPRAAYRVCRGGGWNGVPRGCRSADRDFGFPGRRNFNLGFRLAVSLQSVG